MHSNTNDTWPRKNKTTKKFVVVICVKRCSVIYAARVFNELAWIVEVLTNITCCNCDSQFFQSTITRMFQKKQKRSIWIVFSYPNFEMDELGGSWLCRVRELTKVCPVLNIIQLKDMFPLFVRKGIINGGA